MHARWDRKLRYSNWRGTNLHCQSFFLGQSFNQWILLQQVICHLSRRGTHAFDTPAIIFHWRETGELRTYLVHLGVVTRRCALWKLHVFGRGVARALLIFAIKGGAKLNDARDLIIYVVRVGRVTRVWCRLAFFLLWFLFPLSERRLAEW